MSSVLLQVLLRVQGDMRTIMKLLFFSLFLLLPTLGGCERQKPMTVAVLPLLEYVISLDGHAQPVSDSILKHDLPSKRYQRQANGIYQQNAADSAVELTLIQLQPHQRYRVTFTLDRPVSPDALRRSMRCEELTSWPFGKTVRDSDIRRAFSRLQIPRPVDGQLVSDRYLLEFQSHELALGLALRSLPGTNGPKLLQVTAVETGGAVALETMTGRRFGAEEHAPFLQVLGLPGGESSIDYRRAFLTYGEGRIEMALPPKAQGPLQMMLAVRPLKDQDVPVRLRLLDSAGKLLGEKSITAGRQRGWMSVMLSEPPGGWPATELILEQVADSVEPVLLAVGDLHLQAPIAQPLKSVVLVVIDNLPVAVLEETADGTSVAPELRALAAEGTYFRKVFSSANWSRPAQLSLLTALSPERTAIPVDELYVPASARKYFYQQTKTAADSFRQAGYRTVAFMSNFFLAGTDVGVDPGFDQLVNDYRPKIETRANVDRAISWIQANGDQPFFLFLHLNSPHLPHAPPTNFLPERLRSLPPAAGELWERFHPAAWANVSTPEQAVELERDLYLAEVRYADAEVGRLIRELQKLDRNTDTLLAVTSDHGGGFGQFPGEAVSHARGLFDLDLQVPVILHGDGVVARTDERLVSQVDLLPTIWEMVGLPLPAAWQGRSWLQDKESSPAVFSLGKEDHRLTLRADGGRYILHRVGLEFFLREADMASGQDSISLLHSPEWMWLDAEIDQRLFMTSPGYNLRFQGTTRQRIQGEARLAGPIYLARGARIERDDRLWVRGQTLYFDLNVGEGDRDWLQLIPLGAQTDLDLQVRVAGQPLADNDLLLGTDALPLAEAPFRFKAEDFELLEADRLPPEMLNRTTVNLWYRSHLDFAAWDNETLPVELRNMLRAQGYIR